MSTPQETPDNAFKRAGDFNDSLRNIPGYTDDTMFIILRYSDKARRTLRQKDFDDFLTCVKRLSELSSQPSETAGSVEERYAKMSEARTEALSYVKGFPDLERDFDQFISSTRATVRAMKSH